MRPYLWIAGVFVGGLMLIHPPVYGEMLQGSVALVNMEANLFKMYAKDPFTGERKNLLIVVTRDTSFRGADSMFDLKVGNDISVEARLTKDGEAWKAASVNVPMSEISETADEDLKTAW